MNRNHIIQEIKRTAQQNGGKPLGKQKFASETGIKESDWYGIHWSRWGDALHEAGFSPNMLQGAFESSALLEKYAILASELGRLPSVGDLRLRKRSVPDFPSHNTFHRFGTKSDLVKQLADFCRNSSRFGDVVRLCEEYSPHQDDTSESANPQIPEMGFVYMIKSGRYYKIGKTNTVSRRERELAIQLPEKATTVHVIKTDDPSGIEAYWHKRFAEKRKNGEWFELDRTDVVAFRRRKFM